MARNLLSAAPTGRVGRYPKHPFHTREQAYVATPFFAAPVLPNETLDNLYFESRVITDPIVNSIIGWKKQYFFFYVRIRDLLVDAMADMFVDPTNAGLAGTYGITGNDTPFYTANGGIDYLERAYQKIINHHFRDDGETYADHTIANGLNIVQIRDKNWMDSLTDEDDVSLGGDPSSTTDMEEMQSLLYAFQQLQALNIAKMSFEDWLRSYGISIPEKDEDKPELLAMFSDFQYPSNAVDYSDGSVSSAVSWVFKNGSKQPKFFMEPGFIIGISVTRPKVYQAGQAGMAMAHLERSWDWLPNYLNEAAEDNLPATSLKEFLTDTGPLGDRLTAIDGYWFDTRDLFLYGDQFHNYGTWTSGSADPADDASNHLFNTISATDITDWKYLTDAQTQDFFVSGTDFYIKQDGYVSLSVKGKQVDYTFGNLRTDT